MALEGHPFEANGFEVVGHGFDGPLEARRYGPDRHEYGCDWPIVVVSTNVIGSRPTFWDIIEADGPAQAFNGLEDAVLQVSGFTFTSPQGRDVRPLSSHLILWDYRGRISRCEIATRRIVVEVEPPSSQGLKLLGSIVTAAGPFGIAEPRPGTVERRTDDPIQAVRLQLKAGDDALDEIAEVAVSLGSHGQEGVSGTPIEGPRPWGSRDTWSPLGALGSGGQGVTEKVHRAATSQVGVMKTMRERNWPSPERREKALSRFRLEIAVTKSLSHPFILRVLDADADADEPWIVTEFMQFGSLHDHLGVYRGDAWRSLRAIRDVAVALAALHSKGLVHRDVKPKNILLRDLDHPVLGDFGIVHDPDATEVTSLGEKVGASWFRPPEAETGRVDEPPANFDVYSLGKVLWTLLTGGAQRFMQQGFRENGYNLVELLGRPELEPVNQLLDRMVVADSARRLQSMSAVITELDSLLACTMSQPAGARAGRPDPVETLTASLPRAKGLLERVERHLAVTRANYFDPSRYGELFVRYESLRTEFLRSEILRDLPERPANTSPTSDFDGRGYIMRTQIESLRDDLRYAITVIEEDAKLAKF
ncbi:MAG: serine/threonine protein kinase [Myxococcales bacterium]|nr:serine/threonine protein kinase [Myxococcales bacterium]